MTKLRRAVLISPLLFATSFLPATAQYNRNNDNHSNFNNGVRNGGRDGNYYNDRSDRNYNNGGNYNNGRNDNRYQDDHRRDQGGIGPGKGALIGAGGGALLGAVFGGGLKGTIVGGAAGAGIGAVLGQANQNSKNNNYYRH